ADVSYDGRDGGGLDEKPGAAISQAGCAGAVEDARYAAVLRAAGAGVWDMVAGAVAAGCDFADLGADGVAVLCAGGAVEFSCRGCNHFHSGRSFVCVSAGAQRSSPTYQKIGSLEGAQLQSGALICLHGCIRWLASYV